MLLLIRVIACSSLLLLSSLALSAQDDRTDSADSTAAPQTRVFGALDGYWRYGFNESTATTSPGLYHNVFTIGWLSFGVEHTWKGGGMRGDLSFGQRTVEFLKDDQDILTYVRNVSIFQEVNQQLLVEFGIFPSYVGYEYDDPWRNPNYSPSYVYSWTPVGFLGARAVYSPDEIWSFTFGVYNSSTQRLDSDVQKHVDFNLEYDTDNWYTEFSITGGTEPNGSTQIHLDWIGDISLGDDWNLGYNYYRLLYRNAGSEVDRFWQDVVLYLTYSASDELDLTLRADRFHDPDGFIYGQNDLNITAFTLTPRFQFGRVRVYPELRADFSDQPLFLDNEGIAREAEVSFVVGVAYLFE